MLIELLRKPQLTVWKYIHQSVKVLILFAFILFNCVLLISCSDTSSTGGLADLELTPPQVTAEGPVFDATAAGPTPCVSAGPESAGDIPLLVASPSGILPDDGECLSLQAEPLPQSKTVLKIPTSLDDPSGDFSAPPVKSVNMYGEVPYQFADSPPGAATLSSPSGSASSTKPTFQWEAVESATWYWIWVRDSETMDTSGEPRIKQWVTAEDAGCGGGSGTCNWTANTDLSTGNAAWWIQTWNDAGYGPWSNRMNFTVPDETSPPPAATLVSPDSDIDDVRPTFTWNAVSTATWYYVWVRDSNTQSGDPRIAKWVTPKTAGCESGTGTCSWAADKDLASGNATWWINTWNEAVGSGNLGPWSSGMSFSVATGTPPAAELISPDSEVETKRPTFEWEAVPEATWYYVWVRDSKTKSGDPRIARWVTPLAAGCESGSGTCSWKANRDLADGDATWWINTWNEAVGSGNLGPWSSGMSFSVAAGPPPAATLISPDETVQTNKPTFEWNAVSTATWYKVWVRDSQTQSGNPRIAKWVNPQTAGCSSGTGTCSWTADQGLASGDATWWINTWNDAVGSGKLGPWSTGMEFIVDVTVDNYTFNISVSDAESSLDELAFGVRQSAQSVDAPPAPPEGALHAYFSLDGDDLFQDLRGNSHRDLTWNLHYSIGAGTEIILEWSEEDFHTLGTISIRDTSGNILVPDMTQVSSYTFSPATYPSLRIEYRMD